MSAAKQVFGVLAFVAFLGSSAYGLNNVQSVEVYVPDCNDCGMTFLGRIELQARIDSLQTNLESRRKGLKNPEGFTHVVKVSTILVG